MAGLNPVEIDEVVELIKKIRDRGMTLLVIEHVIKAIRSLSDRVMVLASRREDRRRRPDARPRRSACHRGLSRQEARMNNGVRGSVLLEINGLHAGYGAVPVLFGIDMTV